MFRSPKFFKKVFPKRIWGISVVDNSIFLTFDDGPHPDITPWVLDFLQERNIKATFFCVGENVQRYPELYNRILNEGHKTGNHTMNHLNGMKSNRKAYLDSIENASKLIDSNLFRPPYGRMNRKLDNYLSNQYKIIMWSWLSKDYDNSIAVEKIIHSSSKIQKGDILVFHDNIKTKDRLQSILPRIVDMLSSKDFSFKLLQ